MKEKQSEKMFEVMTGYMKRQEAGEQAKIAHEQEKNRLLAAELEVKKTDAMWKNVMEMAEKFKMSPVEALAIIQPSYTSAIFSSDPNSHPPTSHHTER